MNIKFTYFDFPFWRAEVCRLALYMGDKAFIDHRIQRDEFIQRKKAGDFPFDQLPVMEIDGEMYSQSLTLARLCGKISGLYPKGDQLLEAQVDMVLDACAEINYMISPSMKEKDKEKKLSQRKILREETIPKWLANMERLLLKNKKGPFFVGPGITVADLAFWRLFSWIKSGMIDNIPSSIALGRSGLLSHFQIMEDHPKVKEWMKSKYPKMYEK